VLRVGGDVLIRTEDVSAIAFGHKAGPRALHSAPIERPPWPIAAEALRLRMDEQPEREIRGRTIAPRRLRIR